MKKLKIGDRVRYTYPNQVLTGWTGTVATNENNGTCLVEFDRTHFMFHDGLPEMVGRHEPLCKAHHGWYVGTCMVERIEEPDKIVVLREGNTVTATTYVGKRKVKSAVTKCSPDDTFDFRIGAQLAIDRLYNDTPIVKHDERSQKNSDVKSESKSVSFRIGDKVKMTDYRLHCHNPEYYPKKGTVGTVVGLSSRRSVRVHWEKGSTSCDDVWSANPSHLEKLTPLYSKDDLVRIYTGKIAICDENCLTDKVLTTSDVLKVTEDFYEETAKTQPYVRIVTDDGVRDGILARHIVGIEPMYRKGDKVHLKKDWVSLDGARHIKSTEPLTVRKNFYSNDWSVSIETEWGYKDGFPKNMVEPFSLSSVNV